MELNRLLTACLGLSMASAGMANALEADIQKIIDEGKNRNRAYHHLTELTEKIGARLTGSPQAQKACEWAMDQFKSFGCTNVHLEQWGEMAVGSYRGPTQSVKMTLPYEKEFVFTTPAWSAGTNGLRRGQVVMEPKTMADLQAKKAQFKGAWVLMNQSAGMRGAGQASDEAQKINAELDALGIHGRIFGTGDERVHTSGRFTNLEWDKLPTEVRIMVRKSDAMTARAYLTMGQKVEISANIDNRWVKGPIPLYNVIAEIKGSEKPDEVVIICGHLDSWNGPGSKGANDNGTGSTVAIEAARILTATKVKPKRTIRFILWTGEEQGLLGSRAYVEKHKAEMEKISAVLNDDGGTNYQGGYSVLSNMIAMFNEAIAPVQKAFPDLPMENDVIQQMQPFGSSDHAPFVWEGVPAFFTKEKGKADYGYVWHTQHDRREHSDPYYMAQSSTNHAAVAYYLACHEQLVPHFPKPDRSGQRPNRPLGNYRLYGPGFDFMDHDHDHDDPNHNHDDDWYYYVTDVLSRMARGATTWK